MKRRRILQAGLSLFVGSPLLAAVKAGRFDAAADALQNATASGQVESATFYARRNDEEFSQAFGGAATVDASFLLGSISKPIAVAAIMSLFETGEFKLDDRVVEYLPEFQGDGRESITMRQLLTHNSGLPDQLPENALTLTHLKPCFFAKKPTSQRNSKFVILLVTTLKGDGDGLSEATSASAAKSCHGKGK